MSRYYVIKASEIPAIWSVREKSTGHSIGVYSDKQRARHVSNFFEGGGAFNGWTPAFITISFCACQSDSENPYGGPTFSVAP